MAAIYAHGMRYIYAWRIHSRRDVIVTGLLGLRCYIKAALTVVRYFHRIVSARQLHFLGFCNKLILLGRIVHDVSRSQSTPGAPAPPQYTNRDCKFSQNRVYFQALCQPLYHASVLSISTDGVFDWVCIMLWSRRAHLQGHFSTRSRSFVMGVASYAGLSRGGSLAKPDPRALGVWQEIFQWPA